METLQNRGLVRSHDIIPMKFRNHYVVNKLHYNIDYKRNKVYLPIYGAQDHIKLNKRRKFSHQIYNSHYERYVERCLYYVDDMYDLDSLVGVLAKKLKFN